MLLFGIKTFHNLAFPFSALATSGCTSCAVSLLNLSPFPGRPDLLLEPLPPLYPGGSYSLQQCPRHFAWSHSVYLGEFRVHSDAGTPGLLGKGRQRLTLSCSLLNCSLLC